MTNTDPVLDEEEPLHAPQGGIENRMTGIMGYLVVGMGGFFGANVRFLMGRWASQKWGMEFPYGTFLINSLGCFILGFFATLATRFVWNDYWRLFIAIGFVGAFTTFSTFEYETFELVSQSNFLRAAANIIGSVVIGFCAVFVGSLLARLLLRDGG